MLSTSKKLHIKIVLSLLAMTLLFVVPQKALATGGGSLIASDDPPPLEAAVTTLGRGVNLAISAGGVVFAFMIGFGAIKMATSLGDPKGMQGAGMTWTFGLLGAFIVFGAVFILGIIGSIVGAPGLFSAGNLLGQSSEAIVELREWLNPTTAGGGGGGGGGHPKK